MFYRRSFCYWVAEDRRCFGSYVLWLCFRALPSLIAATVFLLLLSAGQVRASVDGMEDVRSVESGQLLLKGQEDHAFYSAPMHSSKVHFDISGMVAVVHLEQTFRNTSEAWVEAVYAFPLPDNASVRAMEMRIGERRIVGSIKEKSLAKKIYNKARAAGKKASLVEQQRPNLFTNRIANIGPGEQLTVELEYVQAVGYAMGEFSLRFPMTITPRYIPGNPVDAGSSERLHEKLEMNPYLGWALPTDQVPDAHAITPPLIPARTGAGLQNPISITAALNMGMPLAMVEADYHQLAMTRTGDSYELKLVAGESEMDRDFVLNWRAITGSSPQAAVFHEQVDGQLFSMLMIVPPDSSGPKAIELLPRETVFVIDTSGSMGGVAIEQAKRALDYGLQNLHPNDAFNIIEFNSSHTSLFTGSVVASRHNIARAREFVRQLSAGGGTEMLPALTAALQADKPQTEILSQVVFITDGAVGNETALFEAIVSQLGNKRLFTVGIGSAPNSWFMRKSAQFGRGTHAHIGDLAEVETTMAALFTRIAAPIATNINLEWPGEFESYPQRIPDLYLGEPIMLAIKSNTATFSGDIRMTGDLAGKSWSRVLQQGDMTSAAAEYGQQHPGVATLWARGKVADLLDQKILGRDEDAVRADVLEVALAHSLLSPYTSFVAVEERVSREPGSALRKAGVPNTQPRGQSPQPYAYPRTATMSRANLLLGSFMLFIAMMIFVMRREEVDHVATAQA
ncbi:MAG: marine proteobacterial sortase target protein [Halioglobus sp.]